MLPARAKDVEMLAEHLKMSDTGVPAIERDGYDVQVEQLVLPNKPNSNVNIGSALACRCTEAIEKAQTSLRMLAMVWNLAAHCTWTKVVTLV